MVVFFIFSVTTFAQTAGTLSFTCSTDAPSGTWGTKHVLAIWIEDTQNPSHFIKTKAKYGHDEDHLTSWKPKSGGNIVDAVTGATLSSYGTQSVIWNGTDINNNVVSDGTYKVFIEMGWGRDKTNQHSVMSFVFPKGAELVQLSPTGSSNYSDVAITWTPTLTLVSQIQNNDDISVFPNPSNGIVSLDFKQVMHSAIVTGILIYKKSLENDFSGIYNIDLSSNSKGLYFVKVHGIESEYIFKVILVQ